MKKNITTISLMILVAVLAVSAQLRPPLNYSYDVATYGYPTTTDPSWKQDTMVLRAVLDSNGYKGSCLPFITDIVSDKSTIGNNIGRYRIAAIGIYDQAWLKKIPSNISQLLYLWFVGISNCPNLTSVTGFNQYLTNLGISNTAISSLDFDPQYLKSLSVSHCKNFSLFSGNLKSIKTLYLPANGLTDITGLMLGDSLGGQYVRLDSNGLTTIPLYMLQKMQLKNLKVKVNYNALSCAPAAVITILDQISFDPNWKATQKICTQVTYKIPLPSVGRTTSSSVLYNILGKKIAGKSIPGVYVLRGGTPKVVFIK